MSTPETIFEGETGDIELTERAMITAKRQMNIHQRMHAAMKLVSYIQKDELKSGMKYRVVSHDAVTAKVRPALIKVGVIYYPTDMQYTQNGNRTEMMLKVRFVNIDNPEDYIEVPALGYGCDTQDKGPGKSTSYCVKYALLKAMGLETGDDPDLDQKTEFQQTAPDGSPVPTLEDALKSCAKSIQAVQDGIETDDLPSAAEAWHELTKGEKIALWVAPSKGGPFTTKQRTIMRSDEFRFANGDMGSQS